MTSANKVFYNENLLDFIFPFLSNNDIIYFSSVNKKIRLFSNKTIKDICIKYFSSSFEEYSILQNINENDENDHDSYINNCINWKKIMVCGKETIFLYSTIHFPLISEFETDCVKLQNKFFSSIKDIWSLPPLRKSNLYLENDLNTNHQTFLFDFLYETQDLYYYYYGSEQIPNCKNQDGVFSTCLNNFDVFTELKSLPEQMELLENFRFYSLNFEKYLHFFI